MSQPQVQIALLGQTKAKKRKLGMEMTAHQEHIINLAIKGDELLKAKRLHEVYFPWLKSRTLMTEEEIRNTLLEHIDELKDMDKVIKPIIIELNRAGYTTHWSCAGHCRKGIYERGHIQFFGLLNEKQLKRELQRLGFKNIKVHNYHRTFVSFDRYEGFKGKKVDISKIDIVER